MSAGAVCRIRRTFLAGVRRCSGCAPFHQSAIPGREARRADWVRVITFRLTFLVFLYHCQSAPDVVLFHLFLYTSLF